MALRLPATPPARRVRSISTVYEGDSKGSVSSGIGVRLSDCACCEIDGGGEGEKGASFLSMRLKTMSMQGALENQMQFAIIDQAYCSHAVKKMPELNVSCKAVVKPP